MGGRGKNTFAVGSILDLLERATKEAARSLDSMRDRVDYDRLERVRETVDQVLRELDAVLADRS